MTNSQKERIINTCKALKSKRQFDYRVDALVQLIEQTLETKEEEAWKYFDYLIEHLDRP